MSDDTQMIVSEATLLLRDYLGDQTSIMYQDFYRTKDRATVVASVQELFTEMFGGDKASQLLQNFSAKYAKDPL